MNDTTFLKKLNTETAIDKQHKLATYKQELANIRELLNNTLSDIELRRLEKEAEILRPMNISKCSFV
jgi:uncharacterized protein YjiS (DUF1127 family)